MTKKKEKKEEFYIRTLDQELDKNSSISPAFSFSRMLNNTELYFKRLN